MHLFSQNLICMCTSLLYYMYVMFVRMYVFMMFVCMFTRNSVCMSMNNNHKFAIITYK